MTLLESERLIVRNFQVSDWKTLHEIIIKYQASEFAPYDQQWPTSEKEIRKVTEWFASINLPSIRLLEVLDFQKIGEEMVSFTKGEDGKPIEFVGYQFILIRDEWNDKKIKPPNPRLEPTPAKITQGQALALGAGPTLRDRTSSKIKSNLCTLPPFV